MAIPCPSCGREYDVTLFQFGRTIRCACGERVGLEKRIPLDGLPGPSGEPRFFADAMLGRLARWLRVLGYDTAYDAGIEDGVLVRRAVEDGRRILTRDVRLPEEWRVEGVVLLESDEPLEQLREVVEALGLEEDRPLLDRALFTRCLECNASLRTVQPGEVAAEVPPGVLDRHEAFRRCPECGRVYWEGSHVRRMRATLEERFASD